MYTYLIVDDEPGARELLKKLILRFHPDFTGNFEAGNMKEAEEILIREKVDLVFLDLNLGADFGLDLVSRMEGNMPHFIVTTAHPEHALSAIKNSALDYLLKPISLEELEKTVRKFKSLSREKPEIKLDNLISMLSRHTGKGKIMVPHSKGFKIIDINDIVYLEGEGNYTHIKTVSEKILSSKTLKDYELQLQDFGFYRIHKSNMINLGHLHELIYEDGGIAILTGNIKIPGSRRRLQEFKEELQKLQNSVK